MLMKIFLKILEEIYTTKSVKLSCSYVRMCICMFVCVCVSLLSFIIRLLYLIWSASHAQTKSVLWNYRRVVGIKLSWARRVVVWLAVRVGELYGKN